jgi:hypothetical protein
MSPPSQPAQPLRVAGAFLIAAFGLGHIADAELARVIGARCFVGFIVTAFRVTLPLDLAVSAPPRARGVIAGRVAPGRT